ncbi:MAG TPA: hypothetical protein VJ728_11910, partial [Candidatus Binataceae bacterium]|nr:hypothetical protein [Candidatus Binataceae bacterium]
MIAPGLKCRKTNLVVDSAMNSQAWNYTRHAVGELGLLAERFDQRGKIERIRLNGGQAGQETV